MAGKGVEMMNLICWIGGFLVGITAAIVICRAREQNGVLDQLENGLCVLEDAQAELQRQAVLYYGPKAWGTKILSDAEQVITEYGKGPE